MPVNDKNLSPINPELLKILVCPQCKGEVVYSSADQHLTCFSCKLVYPVQEGIPVMIVEEAAQRGSQGIS